jgi:hypothetical protein
MDEPECEPVGARAAVHQGAERRRERGGGSAESGVQSTQNKYFSFYSTSKRILTHDLTIVYRFAFGELSNESTVLKGRALPRLLVCFSS